MATPSKARGVREGEGGGLVTDEIVEAAARILCELDEKEGRTYPGSFGTDWDTTDAYRADARAVLGAAAPSIAGRALRNLAAQKRADWAPDPCPWVGALDDEAARIEARS